MNEKEQELLDVSLDDIVREFSDNTQVIPDLKDAAPWDTPEGAVPEDTMAVPTVEPPTGDTIRLDKIPHTDTPPAPPESPAPQETVEPFSENWEPEYEQPMGEYVPPQPIPFRPRSRLRELKTKLIAGPERRYYEISEIGVGKLQAAIFLSLLIILISAGAAALYAMGMVQPERMKLMIFGQILIMLLAALLGCYQMMEGVGDLFLRGRFTLNTLLVITFIACCADAVFCLQELRVPICAAFALEVTMSLWATYHRRTTEMGQMDTLRKASRLDSITKVENFHDGRPGFIRGEGQPEDFMDNYEQVSDPQRRQNRYALICLFLSLAIAVAAGVLHSLSMAVLIFSSTLLVAVPASFFVSLTRPMAVLERKLHSLGAVLCGWSGVKALRGKAAVPLADGDMFPQGSTKLNGVKFYGDRDPDEVIAYSAALIRASGGGLTPLFEELLASRNGPQYDVENLQNYPGGGIGGEICGEPVLMGTLKFLKDMGVEVPAGTQVNQAVHLSIDGTLAGLFAINYNRTRFSASGLATLCGDRKLNCVVTSGDFMLSDTFLKGKFGINTRRVLFPTLQERAALQAIRPEPDAPALALLTREGLAPMAYAITGARSLVTACRLGMIIHMIGGILGMLIMLALAVLGSVELLTPVNVLLYQLVWMLPGLLVTSWTRTI
ncbi:MAG: hypothetical protein IJX69_00440 [Oscillospiraceae bacterium]|nr:hypothetical protein [Oscillospiraceae bacterium]